MSKLTTTLADLRQSDACQSGLKRFRAANPEVTDDTPITLEQILDSNGIADALWCLRMWPQYDRKWRLLACDYAETVSHLWNDPACAKAVVTARKYASGQCGTKELSAACSAAWAAAWAAAWNAAWAAAWASARAATNAAKRDAEISAAWAAERSAVWDAAWYAAFAAAKRDAAWNAASHAAALAKQTEMLRAAIQEIEGKEYHQ